MKTIIIDRTNYLQLRVHKGDVVLARDGRDLGTVLRLDYLRRIVWEGDYGVIVKTQGTWDEAFERGTRLKRVVELDVNDKIDVDHLREETKTLVRMSREVVAWVRDDGDSDWVGLVEQVELLANALDPFEKVQS